MSLTLNEYTVKLVNKILIARSQEEVKQFVDDAVKALEQNKIEGQMKVRFIEIIAAELEQFNPMNKDAQQWSNIRYTKIIFNRMKQRTKSTV
jgi:cell division septum initiation protein DivIVA